MKVKISEKCAEIHLVSPFDKVLEVLAEKSGNVYLIDPVEVINVLYLASVFMEMQRKAEASVAKAWMKVVEKYLKKEPLLTKLLNAIVEDTMTVKEMPLRPREGFKTFKATICIPENLMEFEIEERKAGILWLAKVDSISMTLEEFVERAAWACVLRVGYLKIVKMVKEKLGSTLRSRA